MLAAGSCGTSSGRSTSSGSSAGSFRGGYYTQARDAVWDFTLSLRLPHYFWLGFRGFAAAFAWLVVPVSLLALGHSKLPGAVWSGFFGAFLLAHRASLPAVPATADWRRRTGLPQAFNVFAVRADFKRAPWAFAFSVVVTLLFALPLYLFKIEIVPREAAWLPGLIFIAFIYPARLLDRLGDGPGPASRRTAALVLPHGPAGCRFFPPPGSTC